jgi:serine/threonine-protein kinase HipA
MPDRLAVWLYGVRVATVEEERGRLSLDYTEDALTRFPLGSPLLSLRLPLSAQHFEHPTVQAFVDGLLPEDDQRRAIAQDLRLLADDTFGLIRALGRECAGAIVILPEHEPPPSPPTTLTATPLTDAEIERLVANLRSAPLGFGQGVRLSLAGVQEKLLLTRLPDGTWGRPVGGTPSTHILKPPLARYERTVENELFCMRFASHLGLPVAHVETLTVAGRAMLLVERYDRIVHTDGTVDRVHQEDLCQALGFPPSRKYEEDRGPSLRQIARLLGDVAGRDAVETLLRATTFNLLVGNGDAHAKNFSLLHEPGGSVHLAPLYDLMSSRIYGDARLAMKIDGEQRMDRVTAERLLDEAAAWGLRRPVAVEILHDQLERIPQAIGTVELEVPGAPLTLPALIRDSHVAISGQLGM